MRILALRARGFGATGFKIMSAVLAMVTNREHLHDQVCALGDRSARDLGKNLLQTVKVDEGERVVSVARLPDTGDDVGNGNGNGDVGADEGGVA